MFPKIMSVFFKDLKSHLSSITAYVLIMIFLGLSGFFFSTAMSYFSIYSMQASMQPYYDSQGLNLTETVIGNVFFNITVILLLMMPILTMRTIAEEQKQGTLELLLSYSVNEFEIVIGKFLSSSFLYLMMLLPLLSYLYLLQWVGGIFEWGVVLSGFGGLFLVGMAFLSFGIFASSLTESQVISAAISFGFLLFLWMLAWVANFLPQEISLWVNEMSLVFHSQDFFKGIVETKHILFYVLFCSFFLYLATWRLETRKWVN